MKKKEKKTQEHWWRGCDVGAGLTANFHLYIFYAFIFFSLLFIDFPD